MTRILSSCNSDTFILVVTNSSLIGFKAYLLGGKSCLILSQLPRASEVTNLRGELITTVLLGKYNS